MKYHKLEIQALAQGFLVLTPEDGSRHSTVDNRLAFTDLGEALRFIQEHLEAPK